MSRLLSMNLARRPFTNDVLWWVGLGILAGSVLFLAAWNSAQFIATGSQVEGMLSRRNVLEGQRQAAADREKDLLQTIEKARSDLLASRATFANTVIQAHSFSWTRLFNELEKVMPPGVRLFNIRPRVDETIRIRINGMARDAASFWELQDNLDEWPVFSSVYPDAVQPTAARTGIMRGELLISLEMEYLPDARLHLGLPDDQPAPADAQVTVPAEDVVEQASDGVTDETAGTAEVEEESVATPAVSPRAAAPGAERARRRGRAGRTADDSKRVRGGVQRASPLPEGSPGMEKPDISRFSRPETTEGMGLNIQGLNEDGQLIDEDGNVVSIEDLINTPGGIRPGESPDPNSLPNAQGMSGAAGEKARPADEPGDDKAKSDDSGRELAQ